MEPTHLPRRDDRSAPRCERPGCTARHVARGMCRKHYSAWHHATPPDQRPPNVRRKPSVRSGGVVSRPAADRFRAKVDRSGGPDACWPWTGGTTDAGYGVFHPRKGETVGAHRFALEQALGRPLVGWALHGCDNPPCCNTGPGHLYEGDHAQNMADKVARDRQRKGAATPSSIMNAAGVLDLRERFAGGELLAGLAADYGISLAAASKIVNGKTWAHVGGPTKTHGRPGRRYTRRTA